MRLLDGLAAVKAKAFLPVQVTSQHNKHNYWVDRDIYCH